MAGEREHPHGPIEHAAHEGLGLWLTLLIVLVVLALILVPLVLLAWTLS